MRRSPVVVVAGTFDAIHLGHLQLFSYAKEQAAKLGGKPVLVVIVARDSTVRRIKGVHPLHTERERLSLVSSLRIVGKAILGGKGRDLTAIITEISPDLVVLGYDQPREIELKLKKSGFAVLRAPARLGRGGVLSTRRFKQRGLGD